MSKFYKVTKYFRNKEQIVYAVLNDDETFTDDMCQSVGEHLPGGEANGWRVESEQVDEIPDDGVILPRTTATTVY